MGRGRRVLGNLPQEQDATFEPECRRVSGAWRALEEGESEGRTSTAGRTTQSIYVESFTLGDWKRSIIILHNIRYQTAAAVEFTVLGVRMRTVLISWVRVVYVFRYICFVSIAVCCCLEKVSATRYAITSYHLVCTRLVCWHCMMMTLVASRVRRGYNFAPLWIGY